MHEPKPYVPQLWPRWILTPSGNKMIVTSCQQMSSMMGEEYGEDAELVVKVPPVPEPPAADPTPKPEETVEDVMAAMAKQAEASHAEVLHDADPMGIFATPEPEETAQLEKKRGKAAKE